MVSEERISVESKIDATIRQEVFDVAVNQLGLEPAEDGTVAVGDVLDRIADNSHATGMLDLSNDIDLPVVESFRIKEPAKP